MEKFDRILKANLKNKPFQKAAEGAEICFYASKWNKIAMTPISYKEGLLKVAVKSSPAAAELQMIQGELVDFVNAKFNYKVVRLLRIVVIN
ncbi:MAG: DciA family protein [Candidatus Berkelbacteria bacterium]|nr:DciA family protein [Candidatus Berkelbacteria bacterium]